MAKTVLFNIYDRDFEETLCNAIPSPSNRSMPLCSTITLLPIPEETLNSLPSLSYDIGKGFGKTDIYGVM